MCYLHFKNEFIEPHISIPNRLPQVTHSKSTLDIKRPYLKQTLNSDADRKMRQQILKDQKL